MDLTNAQWEVHEPFFAVESQSKRGRPRKAPRAVMNRILWICRTGPAGMSTLEELKDCRERLLKIIGGRAYVGKFAMACKAQNIQFEIPKWPRNKQGFILEKKRWVVEQSFA